MVGGGLMWRVGAYLLTGIDGRWWGRGQWFALTLGLGNFSRCPDAVYKIFVLGPPVALGRRDHLETHANE